MYYLLEIKKHKKIYRLVGQKKCEINNKIKKLEIKTKHSR